MAIEELQEPIWEKQKGETPNQYCYFLEFLEFPTFNLKDFHRHLCDTYQKKLNSAEKAPKIPKYNTVKGWSADNKWMDRKTKKRAVEKEDLLERMNELDKKHMMANFERKKRIKDRLLDKIEEAVMSGESLSQINQGMLAVKVLHEDDLLDQEKPTSFEKKDIDMGATVKGDVKVSAETKLKKMKELADRMEIFEYD